MNNNLASFADAGLALSPALNQYQCTDARTGVIKTGTVTAHVLILEFISCHDESKAIKFFQCELSANKKNHSAPRKGDFAKLYRLTFGTDPGRRFSKSQQLIKHFIGRFFYCETELATDKKTGECYLKITDIKPVEIQSSEEWTGTGAKLRKPRKSPKTLTEISKPTGTELATNYQNPLVSRLATDWQPTGNELATTWQPTGNTKSPQPAKKLGLQPFSIPLNHPYQDNKTTDTQEGNEEKNAKLSATGDEPKTTIIHQPMAGETDEDFQDRFLTESVAQLLAGVSVRTPLKSETSRI